MVEQNNKRKRGSVLNEAIFNAAITLLENKGYEAVTFNEIAKMAQTSRSVLYRRWKAPFDLLYEASNAKILTQRTSLHTKNFNTGSLRNDLLAVLVYMFENTKLFPKNLIPAMMFEISKGNNIFNQGYFSDTGFMDDIFENALKRGEISHLPNEIQRSALFQLQRYYMIFDLNLVNQSFLEQLVDDVLIPIYVQKN